MKMLIKFLSQSGPRAQKHASSWAHPISTFVLHYFLITLILISVHDYTLGDKMMTTDELLSRSIEEEQKRQNVAKYVFVYFSILLIYRVLQNSGNKVIQRSILYENTWLCNSTLFMGALGLWTRRDVLVLGHVVAVSIDQVLWYVDLTGWAFSGFKKFPIGVAKYITWPQTSWATRITCTHHLWTIPSLVYACDGIQFPFETYLFSIFIVVLNVSISRWLTPFVIEVQSKGNSNDDKYEVLKYLNVNLAHELWRDITFEVLQIQRDNPPTFVYLFRLLWRWQIFNGIVFYAVVFPLSNFFLSR